MLSNSIVLSIMAGACTAIGAVILFMRKSWGNRSLAFFLGLAAGVMVAVVVFDMMPSALVYSGPLRAILGLLLGMVILGSTDASIFDREGGMRSLKSLGYLIMLGIALHDLPEGMAIAFGEEMKGRTGMVIALGIGIHNIPEGMAIAAPLLMAGIRKRKVLLQVLLVGLVTPMGTVLGKYLVGLLPELLPLMLGLASGIMLYLVFFQLWPQAAAKNKKSRWYGFWLGVIIIFIATFI